MSIRALLERARKGKGKGTPARGGAGGAIARVVQARRVVTPAQLQPNDVPPPIPTRIGTAALTQELVDRLDIAGRVPELTLGTEVMPVMIVGESTGTASVGTALEAGLGRPFSVLGKQAAVAGEFAYLGVRHGLGTGLLVVRSIQTSGLTGAGARSRIGLLTAAEVTANILDAANNPLVWRDQRLGASTSPSNYAYVHTQVPAFGGVALDEWDSGLSPAVPIVLAAGGMVVVHNTVLGGAINVELSGEWYP